MTDQHLFTYHESDSCKYLQMGWDWAIEEFSLRWADAIQSDLEHGVASLNVKAAKELADKYPKIFAFGEVLKSLETKRPQQQQQDDN